MFYLFMRILFYFNFIIYDTGIPICKFYENRTDIPRYYKPKMKTLL